MGPLNPKFNERRRKKYAGSSAGRFTEESLTQKCKILREANSLNIFLFWTVGQAIKAHEKSEIMRKYLITSL